MVLENKKTKVAVILTCHNRKETTVNCVKKLVNGNRNIIFQFIIVDDGSTDGTVQELEKIKTSILRESENKIHIVCEDGNQYWAGGMRKGMMFAKEKIQAEYCLLVNDDVDFFECSIEKMIKACRDNIVVGATCDEAGKFTYGGIRYKGRGIHFDSIGIDEEDRECDTFNGNCVLIPFKIFIKTPVIDSHYVHTLGDFDYGLEIKRAGFKLIVANFYAGRCEWNSKKGTWKDTTLSRWERIKRKESIKGAPFKQWFYYLKKNFGLKQALLHSFTPYVKIWMERSFLVNVWRKYF